jgi:hypothetical protein
VLVGAGALTRPEVLLAATLASDGRPSASSHFSSLWLRGFGDWTKRPEVTVEHDTDIVARGVTVHRTRRLIVPEQVQGVPCTSIEQTLLDVAPRLPERTLHQILTSAWRQRATTPEKVLVHIEHFGGRGVNGTRKLRRVADVYSGKDRPPGSEAEADYTWDLMHALEAAGIEPPVLQFRIDLGRGVVVTIDFGWPERRKLLEVMGAAAHADYVRQDEAYERATLIRAQGWDLRDVAPRALRERRYATIASIVRWLQTSVASP